MPTWVDKPLPEMVERLWFSTDVLRPYRGEWRAVRRDSRLELNMTFRMSDERFSRLRQTILANVAADWVVPFWHERTRRLSLTNGQTVIPVNTDADYRVGGLAMIWSSCDDYETATIDSVGVGSITLSAGLGVDYVGAAVMPAHNAFINGSIQVGRQNRNLIEFSLIFQLRDAGSLGATVWTTYQGYEVLNCENGYLSRLEGIIRPNIEYMDSDLGPVVLEEARAEVDQLYAVELSKHAWDVKQFLHKIRGRDMPFWVKAWGGRLHVDAAGSGSNTIQIDESLAVADWVGRHIVVDGIYREVTAAVDLTGAKQNLTLDSVLGADVAAGAPCHLLMLVRCDSDDIEISHVHGFSNSVSFPVMEDQAA